MFGENENPLLSKSKSLFNVSISKNLKEISWKARIVFNCSTEYNNVKQKHLFRNQEYNQSSSWLRQILGLCHVAELIQASSHFFFYQYRHSLNTQNCLSTSCCASLSFGFVDCLLTFSTVYFLVSSNLNLLIVFNTIHTTIVIACLKILLIQNGEINLKIDSHILAKNKVYNWLFKINTQLSYRYRMTKALISTFTFYGRVKYNQN